MNKSITALVLATVLWLPQVASASTLTQGQVDAIIGLLIAFNVDQATLTIVRDELKPESIQSFHFVPVVQTATATTTETHQATPQGVLAVPNPVPPSPAPTQTIAFKNPMACATDLKTEYTLNGELYVPMAVFVSSKTTSVMVDVTPSNLDPHSSDYPYHKDITSWHNSVSKSCGEHYSYTLNANQKGTYTVTVTTPETSKATTIQVN